MTLFQKFLDQLAVVLEFKELKPDSHGACLLIMKQSHVPLLFELDDQLVPNSILLSSPVTEMRAEQQVVVLNACLKKNQQMEETLSRKPDEDAIYLHRRISPDITHEELKPIINDFIAAVLKSKQDLEKVMANGR